MDLSRAHELSQVAAAFAAAGQHDQARARPVESITHDEPAPRG